MIWATSSWTWYVMYCIYIFEFCSKVLKMIISMKMIVFLCKYLWIHDQNFFSPSVATNKKYLSSPGLLLWNCLHIFQKVLKLVSKFLNVKKLSRNKVDSKILISFRFQGTGYIFCVLFSIITLLKVLCSI